ncbi:MAG TPA: response regulator [bacterium]|nr:response regulator [bacterium]HOL48739.1 response regulator [bacterium]HPQ20060.1 response regulator [bacterium]
MNKPKIMIVDDSELMRTLIKEVLSKYDLEIIEAENGRIALIKFEELQPDLILLDITMPEMDGITFLNNIPKDKVKVIMLSALGQRAIVLDCLKKGAVSYIVKPFEESQLIKTISKFIKLVSKN